MIFELVSDDILQFSNQMGAQTAPAVHEQSTGTTSPQMTQVEGKSHHLQDILMSKADFVEHSNSSGPIGNIGFGSQIKTQKTVTDQNESFAEPPADTLPDFPQLGGGASLRDYVNKTTEGKQFL